MDVEVEDTAVDGKHYLAFQVITRRNEQATWTTPPTKTYSINHLPVRKLARRFGEPKTETTLGNSIQEHYQDMP